MARQEAELREVDSLSSLLLLSMRTNILVEESKDGKRKMMYLERELRSFREGIAGVTPMKKSSLERDVKALIAIARWDRPDILDNLEDIQQGIERIRGMEDRVRVDQLVCQLINKNFQK